MVTKHYLVSGLVQGVGFRNYVLKQALELGLFGWVRNLPTGHVEILAAGTAEKLERFLTLVEQGPPRSRVNSIEVKVETSQPHENTFMIK